MKDQTFKIVSLEASNIKVLKAVHITPDKNVVTLSGANGAGKSSVLDSIAYALGGKDAVCDQPIRRGASKAEVICKLGGLIVTRKFSQNSTTLTVTNDEGVPQKTPQAILDALVGNLAFDPLSFARMSANDQLRTLRELVGLDFSKQDAERARIYTERTMVNREYENAKTLYASAPHHTDVSEVEVSVSELQQQLQQANATNTANAQQRSAVAIIQQGRAGHAAAVAQQEQEIARLKAALMNAQTELGRRQQVLESTDADIAAKQAELANLKDISTDDIAKQILASEDINRKVRQNVARRAHKKVLDEKGKQSDALTAQIEGIDKAKEKALSEAKFPLPGLTFDDGAVLFNSIPFSQLSDGEKLRISVAVGMAINPKLRVIFIRDGSLLDADGLRTVAELAEKNDYQVWLEDARSTDPTALVIEAGEVKQVEAEEKEQQPQLV